MQTKSQLFQLLALLSPAEFSDLGDYLASPFCNTVKRLKEFHTALKPFHPNFDAMRLTQEELFAKIYPEGKPFNGGELRALMTKFYRVANEFLAFNELKQDEVLKAKLTTISLSRKDNYDLFAEKAEALIQHLLGKKERDLAHYLDLFEINRYLFFHPQTQKQQAHVDSLEQVTVNLDKFFTLAKLYLAAEQLNRARTLDEKPQIKFLEGILEEGKKFASENRVFAIYLNALQLQLNMEDEIAFQELKNDFFKYADLLPKEEQNSIFPFLVNFTTRQGNLGNEKYEREKFELYKFGIESGNLIENNKFPKGLFFNLVSLGFLIDEHNWVEQFIKDYQRFLPLQELDLNLALSQIERLFFQKKFLEVIHQLSLLVAKEPDIVMLAKRRSIQCFFECYLLGSYKEEALVKKIEAFERYLNRNKTFSKGLLEAYKKFCKAVKLLAEAYFMEKKYRQEHVEEVKKLLAPGVFIACRKWLSEKLAGL